MSRREMPRLQTVDVIGPAASLRELIAAGKGAVREDYLRRGDEIAALYFDRALAASASGFQAQLAVVVADAIEDLSNGAPILSRNVLGLVRSANGLFPFAAPYGAPWPGDVVFSFGLREAQGAALAPATELALPEEDACAAIYRLIVFSAKEATAS